MINLFVDFSTVSALMALLFLDLFTLGMLFKWETFQPNKFAACSKMAVLLQIMSGVFMFLAWFIVTGSPWEECYEGYITLSERCLTLGSCWLAFFLLDIIATFFMSLRAEKGTEVNVMKSNILNHGTVGLLFMIASFILNIA